MIIMESNFLFFFFFWRFRRAGERDLKKKSNEDKMYEQNLKYLYYGRSRK
jgi:hypothetical protein